MSRLNRQFFRQKTEQTAQELLGKILVRQLGRQIISGIIVETEAYVGPHDKASHASRGRTKRNGAMFKEAGCWYVYLVYGFHHCLNIVTEKKDYPSAVLIRALEPLEGIDEMKKFRKIDKISNLTSGPGKLCQALKIGKTFNASSAMNKNSRLYVEDRGIRILARNIRKTKRIGVDYAGPWKDKLLRFYIKNNDFVSKP